MYTGETNLTVERQDDIKAYNCVFDVDINEVILPISCKYWLCVQCTLHQIDYQVQ